VLGNLCRCDVRALADLAGVVEFNYTINESKERMISAYANVPSSVHLSAALPDDDCPGADSFATESLHTKALRVTVSSVPATTTGLLMRH
jgi:hypothetical protein